MKDVDIFFGRLVHFTAIWYFFRFWNVGPGKVWQPCDQSHEKPMRTTLVKALWLNRKNTENVKFI
jgi:hypothetical protein